MPSKETLVIQKIPLDRKPIDHPQSFGRVEQLYLELIENKTKIKQHLVNKDYEPPEHLDAIPRQVTHSPSPLPSPTTSSSSSLKRHKFTPESSIHAPPQSIHSDDDAGLSDAGSVDRFRQLDRQIRHEPETTAQHDDDDVQSRGETLGSRDTNDPKRTQHAMLSNKLQDLLAKRGGGESAHAAAAPGGGDSRFEEYQRSRKRLPTLSELEKQGATTVRRELADASRLQVEDEDLKREMLFKFDLLRKSYKEHNIPTFTIHSDLNMMTRSYEDTVRRLSLDSSVETYKRYLIGAFMLIEYALGRWLKFDMKGYTQQQIVSMSSYEKLLIEIGEKSYMPEGEQWSVEIRLVFLVIINTAFFLVGKMIMNKTGSNIMNAINSMNRATPQEPPKKKMQGPNINLDDLPDLNAM
jgi:hypothetical protein